MLRLGEMSVDSCITQLKPLPTLVISAQPKAVLELLGTLWAPKSKGDF